MQKLSSEARRAAFNGIGVEVDVKNAHPTFLLSLLEEHEPDHNKQML